jgi:hypothetical protein
MAKARSRHGKEKSIEEFYRKAIAELGNLEVGEWITQNGSWVNCIE